jgi:predicted ATP-dependent endonuclease of OLD family
MKLKSFRVQNFHSVIDSGLVKTSEITALIGANQAGKSSLLLGLASMSPDHSYEDFDLTQLEGVSKRYLDGEKKAESIPIIEAHFDLSTTERKELKEIAIETDEFGFTKYYDGSYLLKLGGKDYKIQSLGKIRAANRAVVEALTKFRDASTQHITRQQNLKFAREFKTAVEVLKFSQFGETTVEEALALLGGLQDFCSLGIDDQFKDTIKKFLAAVQEIVKGSLPTSQTEVALSKFLREHLPRTVYFKSFDKLLDEASVSDLRSREPVYKTFSNLLKLSGLRIESLQRIRNEKQRQAYLEQASGQATRLLRKAWNQEEMQIEFRYQGERLMVFIQDSSAVETLLPPSSGSEGFQWFLGFFINFGALTNAAYEDAILLLDDPGVYLHPSAHKDLLNLFEELLSKNVTTIYSTHQPFLIPQDRLDRLRLVTKTPDGRSSVTAKFYATEDREILSPVRAALGMTLEDTLLMGKSTLVTEGPTEKILIEAMIKEFSRRGILEFSNLENLIVIGSPSPDVAKLYSVLLQINGLSYATIFSNSSEGKAARSDLLKAELPEKNLIVFPRATEQKTRDIEDLFTPENYAEALDQVYGSSIGLHFDDLLAKLQQSAGHPFAKAKSILRAKKLELNRVAVARELARVLATQSELSPQLRKSFVDLFSEISKVIPGLLPELIPEAGGKKAQQRQPEGEDEKRAADVAEEQTPSETESQVSGSLPDEEQALTAPSPSNE